MPPDSGRAARQIERLLRRAGLSAADPPDEESWSHFLESVETGLADAERDRYLLERSLDMTTRDTATLHAKLEAALATLTEEQAAVARAWKRQRALAELGRRAVEGAPVPDMLRVTANLAATTLQAPIATIFELCGDELMELRADFGWPSSSRHPIPIAPDSQAHYMLSDPEGNIVVHDYADETRFTPAELLMSQGIRSSVAARIGSAANPFGIISVHSREPGCFVASDEMFVNELAHILTLAIEQDRHAMWLAKKAFHDDLTGLANRALLRDRLEHALRRSQRSSSTVTLLLLDLDGFKLINDSRGHAAGDRLLADVAERIRAQVRGGDTPARIGGDEFAVLVEDSNSETATALAERILDTLREPFTSAEGNLFVRASVGIADNSEPSVDADELLVRADLAMYAAKAAGRDRHQTFTPAMRAELHIRHQLHDDLRTALADGQFVIHYQPLVDLLTGELESFEALIRWQHPEQGLVGPDKFIPAADETSLIIPIGRFVLNEACRQLAEWRSDGIVGPAVRMGVNVAARQLYEPDFPTDVQSALDASGVPAENLTLELTESTLLSDTTFAQHRLQRLRNLGVRIALDDFGTGYSSLSYLRSLPVDVVKIDKSFVQELHHDTSSGDIMVRSIITLCHDLNLEVVAEGIEHKQQLNRTLDMGCDVGQGFLFARPIPPQGVPQYLTPSHEWELAEGATPAEAAIDAARAS